MKKNVMVVFVALLAAICIPGIAQSADGVVLWQIGTPDGAVNPINGSMEYPATGAWTETFDYDVGMDSDPINSPSMPGYIGPANVCDFAGGRPCTDTTAALNIHFTLDCHYGTSNELNLVYDRYGSESDDLYLDGVWFATISATESGFRQFTFSLGELSPGDHTITIQYAGGGSGNGHYIDYLKLTASFLCVPADIKPGSCPNPVNTKSKGVLPAAILGTSDFDVSQIDIETVNLEGVFPLRWSYEDVANPVEPLLGEDNCYEDCEEVHPDGYTDLTLKFDTQEIVAALGAVSDGECRVLTLTGTLKEEFGGTPIFGDDVVVILNKPNPQADKEKNNKK